MDAQTPAKIALITGAHSGIGFEIGYRLGLSGFRVILTARDGAKAAEAAERMFDLGCEAIPRRLDVSRPEEIEEVSAWIGREFGRMDVLVNNAVIVLDQHRPGLEIELGVVRETMETNVCGPLLLIQRMVPLMRRTGGGRIVNISSGLGQFEDMRRHEVAYKMSKASLNAMTRVLADELRSANITVNAVCPGWARTAHGGRAAERSVEEAADTAVWLALMPDGGPTGLFLRDREVIPW